MGLKTSLWAATLLVATGAQAQDLGDMDREAFRAEVRAYLLENPEVLLEAMDVLRARNAAEEARADEDLIADNLEALTNSPLAWVGGNPDGDVTMIEFLDYQCGYCKQAHEDVKELVQSDGNIRYIVMELPILGPESVVAARAATAVLEHQGPEVYAAFHDALMSFRGRLNDDVIGKIAASTGVNVSQMIADMESDSVGAHLDMVKGLAAKLNVNGTPAFVIGNRMVRGYRPLDGMRQEVSAAREAS